MRYVARRQADDQERVLKDASMMIPRTKVNLARAVEELDDLVVSLHFFSSERIKGRADGRTHLRVTRRSRRVKSLKLLPINSRRWKLRDRPSLRSLGTTKALVRR